MRERIAAARAHVRLGPVGRKVGVAEDGAVAQQLAEYPNMTLLEAEPRVESQDDGEVAYQTAKELFKKYPDLKGIVGTSSFDAPGVARAIEELGLTGKVFVSGTGLPAANKEILEKGLVQSLTLWDPADAGYALASLAAKILEVVNGTMGLCVLYTQRNKAPFRHVLFYGPPGTGKTMTAMRFAEYSGLEYAIMSGGDVAPLEEQAVTELHKLFKWINRSRKGVLLFIDEADAFLSTRDKDGMSENIRNALSTMLYHTGTPSMQFMLVLATNRPHDLDSAILDRIDKYYFGDFRRSLP